MLCPASGQTCSWKWWKARQRRRRRRRRWKSVTSVGRMTLRGITIKRVVVVIFAAFVSSVFSAMCTGLFKRVEAVRNSEKGMLYSECVA